MIEVKNLGLIMYKNRKKIRRKKDERKEINKKYIIIANTEVFLQFESTIIDEVKKKCKIILNCMTT
jgi:hypothetical protein